MSTSESKINNIIVRYTKGNNNFIDWKTDFFSIFMKEALHYLHNNPITIIVIDSEF